jgi:hypothetical protein
MRLGQHYNDVLIWYNKNHYFHVTCMLLAMLICSVDHKKIITYK